MIFLAFSLAIFAGLISAIVMSTLFSSRISVTRRLDAIANSGKKAKHGQKRQKTASLRTPSFKIFSSIGQELSAAGILMRPEEYMILWIVLAVIPAAVVAMASGSLITASGLAILGLAAPPLMVRRKKGQRLVKFEKQLGDALMVACNCLRSGLTFTQAMESISLEMPDPISGEFARTLREMHLGCSFERAMENLSKRVPSADLMLLVSAVLIQRQVGGNLSEILETISVTIRERIKLKDDIRVLTATGRTSGIVIGCLPLGIALILMLLNPGYIASFFETQMGINMLIAAAVMEGIGFLFVRKIVSVKY